MRADRWSSGQVGSQCGFLSSVAVTTERWFRTEVVVLQVDDARAGSVRMRSDSDSADCSKGLLRKSGLQSETVCWCFHAIM